ncbi:hypothetical protein AwWohl_08210 [Gammaproteobacteria bacterium]|nr:hypothetical protein AwWohl_08210 [Gammaproteobacteria bacterium]
MSTITRFDLKIDANEKDTIARAAALMGTTMAAFVRIAAQEKARDILDKEIRITMSTSDFDLFTQALNQDFHPNNVLQDALDQAQKVKRV